MSIETITGYVISFILGAVVALFWAYSGHNSRISKIENQIDGVNLEVVQNEITSLKTMISAMGIVNLAADVKVMRESMIFRPDFQQKLGTICAEHDKMHDQIEINSSRLAVLETRTNSKV